MTDPTEDHQGSSSSEIEFALVLSRMIDSVRNDPGDLRQAIYELARYKLQEQFTHADAKVIRQTQQALETAIQGVEAFSQRNEPQQHGGLLAGAPQPQISGPDPTSPEERVLPDILQPRTQGFPARPALDVNDILPTSGFLPYVTRAVLVIVFVVGIVIVFQQRKQIVSLAQMLPTFFTRDVAQEPARIAPAPLSTTASTITLPSEPSPLIPTNYGVYAVSDDKLYELRLLAGRVPDMRVAVSAPIKAPSQTVLPNGHPKFIVFRRDVAANVSDQTDVRVIAKVARDFSTGSDGKKNDDREDIWIIRNIAFPFRSSPVKDNPEMYEIHSDDPASELTPGRYALVIKAQTYDFTIAGDVVDPRQCLERIGATNGTFYTECRKP